jgi:hypothetical protein
VKACRLTGLTSFPKNRNSKKEILTHHSVNNEQNKNTAAVAGAAPIKEGQAREKIPTPPPAAENRHRADGGQARLRPPSQGLAPRFRRAAGGR